VGSIDATWREISPRRRTRCPGPARHLGRLQEDCPWPDKPATDRFLGGGLYEYTLPFVRHLKSKFQIDVELVELSVLDQFAAVATGKVDAAFCRLPLSHDGLVQCAVLFEDKRKLVVPAGHRLVVSSLIDPEELALETRIARQSPVGGMGSNPFPGPHTLWTADCQRACRRNCPGMSRGGGIGRGGGHLWWAGGALLFEPRDQVH
jgi:hypothetical protein